MIATNSPAKARALLREFKLKSDPNFPGEFRMLLESGGPTLRKAFFSESRGLTLDQVGSLLLDRGLIPESPTEADCFDLLESLLLTGPTEKRITKREKISLLGKLDAHVSHQVKNRRCRPYDCPGCGDIAYHAGFDWKRFCECGEVYVCRDLMALRDVAALDYETRESAPF